jgi:hypothetical protein
VSQTLPSGMPEPMMPLYRGGIVYLKHESR